MDKSTYGQRFLLTNVLFLSDSALGKGRSADKRVDKGGLMAAPYRFPSAPPLTTLSARRSPMSASIGSSAISPDDPRLTTIPQRIPFIPPAPTTPYELRLVHHGMTKAATRAAVNRVLAKIYNSGQSRFDRTDTWHAPLFTMMLRSDSYHAGQLARQQDEHYRFFGEMSKSQFTRFDIQFLSTAGNPDAVALDRQAIRKIRSI